MRQRFFLLVSLLFAMGLWAQPAWADCYPPSPPTTSNLPVCPSVPAYVDTSGAAQAISVTKPLPVNQAPTTITGVPIGAASTALESSHVLCATSCNAYGFQVNATTTNVWVMVFNSATVPADGAVTPVKWYQVPSASSLVVALAYGNLPVYFNTGLAIACSTTGPFTKTSTATCTFAGN